jgi:hypothetical protein
MPVTRPTLRFALVMPSKRRQEKPPRFVIGSSAPCFPSVLSRQATSLVEANGLFLLDADGGEDDGRDVRRTPCMG